MSRRLAALLVIVAVATLGCGHRLHVEPNAFAWNGTLSAGSWVHVRNLSGGIRVVRGTGPQVEITAAKRWRHNGNAVRFTELQTSDGIVVCTMYGSGGDCSPTRYSARRTGLLSFFNRVKTDATVSYELRVPPGIRVDLSTVNGDIDASGSGAAVIARSVNGDVSAHATQGPVTLKTVNGDATVTLDAPGDSGGISLKTVNGSIRAELPAQAAAAVDLSTVNGSLRSDFPIATSAGGSSRHLQGVIGAGAAGRKIELKTVNGSVTLSRRG